MDSDYRLKPNKSCRADLVKKYKAIRYEKLNAPRNPSEAASSNSNRSRISMDVTPAKVPRDEHDVKIVNSLVVVAQNSNEIEGDREHHETEKNNVEENCETILGMLHDLIETYRVNSSALGICDSNEDLLITSQKLVRDIQTKAADILDITEKAFVSHEKEMKTFMSSETACPDDDMVFLGGDPARRKVLSSLTDQHREYLLAKGPCRPALDKYPSSITISK